MSGESSKGEQSIKLNDWDRRPWPEAGNPDIGSVHLWVGQCLSTWEVCESLLSILFSAYVARAESLPAKRAFCAVRTFEGRAEMLKAASEAYFSEKPDATLLAQHKNVFKLVKSLSPRRNDIAHGVVQFFFPEFPWPPALTEFPPKDGVTFALYPTGASYKDRSIHNKPAYCYALDELYHYNNEFLKIQAPISSLIGHLILIDKRQAFPERFSLPNSATTSP